MEGWKWGLWAERRPQLCQAPFKCVVAGFGCRVSTFSMPKLDHHHSADSLSDFQPALPGKRYSLAVSVS